MLFKVVTVVTAFYLAAVSLTVYLQNKRGGVNASLAVSIVLVGLWLLGVAGVSSGLGENIVFGRSVFAIAPLGLAALFVFVSQFVRTVSDVKPSKLIIWLVIIGSVAISALSMTDVMLESVVTNADKLPTPIYGKLFPLYAVWLVSVSLLASAILLKSWRGVVANELAQLRTVSYTIAAFVGSATLTNLILPGLLNNDQVGAFAPVSGIILATGLSYAVIRHKFLNIRPVIAKTVSYFLTWALLATAYFLLLGLGLENFVFASDSPLIRQAAIVLFMAIATVAYGRIRQIFDNLSDGLFFRGSYNLQAFIAEINKTVVDSSKISDLLGGATRVTEKYLKTEGIAYYIHSTEHGKEKIIGPIEDTTYIKKSLRLFTESIVESRRRVFLATELDDPEMRKLLESQNIAAFARLTSTKISQPDVGVVLLKSKKNGEKFTTQDIEAVKILSSELSVASENALRFEEISSFNDTLQDKVKEVTAEYARANHQLASKNHELARINRMLTALRQIDLIILQTRATFAGLTQEVSEAIVQASPFAFVSILSLSRPSNDYLDFQGWSVSEDRKRLPNLQDFDKRLRAFAVGTNSTWLSGDEQALTIDVAMLAQQPGDLTASDLSLIKELCEYTKVKSLHIIRLRARNNLVGLMVVGLSDSTPTEQDIEYISRLSEPVGVAIDNKLLLDENQRVLHRLSLANEKLEKLDETKDEFISMASHQLRTPLTSIKGYVSMVLDGDAGKISDPQRKMLAQAFISTQRMVFLIADLLNVSRLRTGKFVIDRRATPLTQVVQSEIDQLQETAAARGLKLVADLPSDLPPLMLDETKTRQVVMNFIDNAIYYTPSGGTITVTLSHTPRSVEFTVADTGIGVARADQRNLFSKYFRAENARKARPDGTGLGLFMAKKVIVAQGGATIFRSKEGKGSTFGFTFPMSTLKATSADLDAAKNPNPALAK